MSIQFDHISLLSELFLVGIFTSFAPQKSKIDIQSSQYANPIYMFQGPSFLVSIRLIMVGVKVS